MIRVALVGPYPLDTSRVNGGLEASFASLVEGLACTRDVEPHVITFVPGLDRPQRSTVGGVGVDYLPGIRRLGTLTLYARERRRLADAFRTLRPEIVHAQDTLRYGYACLKTERRAPVVVSVHGLVRPSVKYMSRRGDRLRMGIAGVALEQYCIRNARYIVQPTRYPEYHFGSEIRGRIVDVGNPVPDRFFSAEWSPEPGRILFVGAVSPLKRPLDVVNAMPMVLGAVPAAHVRIAGDAVDSSYAAHVRARVRALGLDSRVALLGALASEEVLEEYRRASVLVLPSGQETSPMVIGEAMAAGVPVVATRVGGVPYLVEDGATGYLVNVGDVHGLATRFAEVLKDRERQAALGTAGRAKAERCFRANRVAARVRDVYLDALGFSPATP
jgi:glycosyltransferase involved in cell wall biosynthesis